MPTITYAEPQTQETIIRVPAVAAAVLPNGRLDGTAVESALQFAQDQLNRTATELTTSQYPHSTKADGTWNVLPPSGTDTSTLIKWTQGFFPGALWFMYARTGSDSWRQRANNWTRPLEAQQYNMLSHDMGFKFTPSFVAAYKLTGDPYYRKVALAAAGSLASRYNPKVGIISCCDWNDRWQLPLVIDTMMNLELLFWGATQNQLEEDYQGQEGWRDMALNHALRSLADLVRTTATANGSTYHVADYDPFTGLLKGRETLQGAGTETTWSRGQAWAMYGFTMAYRYTRDPRMLEAAQLVTEYYLSRISGDYIPNWDFDSTVIKKDSSAAAVAASALLELFDFVSDATRRQRYWDAALNTLNSLMSSNYLARGTSSRSVLLHGVADQRNGVDVNVGLIYGDYYFIEALRRYQMLDAPAWYGRLSFSEAVHTLGPGNTGTRTVEFDVTPLGASIDGVIGYADNSTNVIDYSGLAIAIRMHPSGVFDARSGAVYSYLNRILYTPNTRYHVRIVADMNAKKYNAWVRPPGGTEIQLANDYAFRNDAPPTDDLGKVAVKSGLVEDEFKVENHTVR